jgi:hypothetical protein
MVEGEQWYAVLEDEYQPYRVPAEPYLDAEPAPECLSTLCSSGKVLFFLRVYQRRARLFRNSDIAIA